MCDTSKDLVQCQPDCLSALLPFLKDRVKDSQWEVRRSAVDTLCTLLNNSFDAIPAEVVSLLSERMMDKRNEVRKFAITGLLNVWWLYANNEE